MLTVHTLHSFKSMNGKLTFLVLKTNRPITHSAAHAHIHFSFIYTVLSCLELLLLKRPYNNTKKPPNLRQNQARGGAPICCDPLKVEGRKTGQMGQD